MSVINKNTFRTILQNSVFTAAVLALSTMAPLTVNAQAPGNFSNMMKGFASNMLQQQMQPKRGNANSVQSIGGGLAKQAAREQKSFNFDNMAAPAAAVALPAAPAAPKQEYRGFNGRTAEQAFFSCKYDSYRAAAPGLKRLKLREKMRIRTYVLDSCMNKEGFFRKKGSIRIPSLSTLTAADFGF